MFGYATVELGDIAEIVRGERVTKKDLTDDAQYPVMSGGFNPLGYLDKYNREANTITVAQYGSAGYVNFVTEKFWANDVCYSIFPYGDINNKYLYYVLVNKQEYIYSLTTKAIPDHLPKDKLACVKIPLPPLKMQQEIVSILDKFSALVSDISTGLPAEIKLRQQQYEYYRDKLLSFKPISD